MIPDEIDAVTAATYDLSGPPAGFGAAARSGDFDAIGGAD